jgi:hypothetical protein
MASPGRADGAGVLHLLRRIGRELPHRAPMEERRPQKAEVSGFFVRLA